MALSRVIISEIFFNDEKCHDLEIGVRGRSRSLKVVPFDRVGMVSHYCSIVTLSLKRTMYFASSLKGALQLGIGAWVKQLE